MKRTAAFAFFAVLSMQGLQAQRSPGSAPSAPGPGTNSPGNPVGMPGSGSPAPGMNQGRNTNQGFSGGLVIVTGKVAMADGAAIPLGLAIKRVCGINNRTVAYTDLRGNFSFQWGQQEQNGVLPDASDSGPGVISARGSQGGFGGLSEAAGGGRISNCEVKVDAPGYTSDTVMLDDRHLFENSNLGTIYLRRLANVEGTSVSATSLAAPSDAKKAYEKAVQAAAKGKNADAEKSFEKAVAIYPKYGNAWLDLGKLRLAEKQTGPARDAFLKALEADSKLVAADAELGLMAASDQNWKDASEYLDAAVRLDAVDYPQLWFPDAVADFNLQKYDAAEKSVREAIKLDAQHKNPQEDQLLGMILLMRHDYAAGAEELRTYLKLAPNAADAEKIRAQIAEVEKMQDPTAPAGGAPANPR